MILKTTRYALRIIPQDDFCLSGDERDTAYIEEVLGLKKEGDFVKLVRRNAHGLNCIAYLETVKGGEHGSD